MMTGRIQISLLMVSLAFGITQNGYAKGGNEGPNGGDGYIADDGKVYLLDLVESNLETTPYFDPQNYKHQRFNKIVAEVKKGLPRVGNDELHQRLAAKLIELSRFNKITAYAVIKALQAYSWAVIPHALIDVPDSHSPVVLPLVQVAVRQVNAVRIDKQYWDKMDLNNQAALILHEAVYGLLLPDNQDGTQSSPRARQIVSAWFENDVGINPEHLQGLISEPYRYLPFYVSTDDFLVDSVIINEQGEIAWGIGIQTNFINRFGSPYNSRTLPFADDTDFCASLASNQTPDTFDRLDYSIVDYRFSFSFSGARYKFSAFPDLKTVKSGALLQNPHKTLGQDCNESLAVTLRQLNAEREAKDIFVNKP